MPIIFTLSMPFHFLQQLYGTITFFCLKITALYIKIATKLLVLNILGDTHTHKQILSLE